MLREESIVLVAVVAVAAAKVSKSRVLVLSVEEWNSNWVPNVRWDDDIIVDVSKASLPVGQSELEEHLLA